MAGRGAGGEVPSLLRAAADGDSGSIEYIPQVDFAAWSRSYRLKMRWVIAAQGNRSTARCTRHVVNHFQEGDSVLIACIGTNKVVLRLSHKLYHPRIINDATEKRLRREEVHRRRGIIAVAVRALIASGVPEASIMRHVELVESPLIGETYAKVVGLYNADILVIACNQERFKLSRLKRSIAKACVRENCAGNYLLVRSRPQRKPVPGRPVLTDSEEEDEESDDEGQRHDEGGRSADASEGEGGIEQSAAMPRTSGESRVGDGDD